MWRGGAGAGRDGYPLTTAALCLPIERRMMKPAPSFCERGVNTFWIGRLTGAIGIACGGPSALGGEG